ncbi:hypothetical protein BVG80_09965 [Sphingobacteriales bacterium TSM_CSM]|nr:hypothetical protein BVG80_09965 [Sphingobacteriales bacterium TSM_CSM]
MFICILMLRFGRFGAIFNPGQLLLTYCRKANNAQNAIFTERGTLRHNIWLNYQGCTINLQNKTLFKHCM